METSKEHYVYVYIDPRNFEEFYYGKGKGSRKDAHLHEDNDSEKVKRIRAIQNAGLKPIIKVIARNLSEHDAFLIEKTLLWKLGKSLTNKSSGLFADNFRPHDTFHQDLSGFDFKNGLYYVNVGDGDHRCWEDCMNYGFLSAGQRKIYSDPIRTLEPGDVVAAYLKGHGYVGIGKVLEKAVRILDFHYNGKTLNSVKLKQPRMFENSDNDRSEYVLKIDWITTVTKANAKNAGRKDKIYSTPLIKASLQGQPLTVDYLQREFEVNFSELMLND